MQKIKKGDEVIVISGRYKGVRGPVITVMEQGNKLIVGGIDVKKHVKANPNAGEKGGIKTKPLPLHRSKVKIYNPVTQKGDRVGIRILEDGRKIRYFKSTNEELEI